MFILIGPHVRHFSDENQTVSNVKKINHGLPLCQNNVNVAYLPGCQIILVKGDHELENVRLNLFRVFCRVLFHTLTNVITHYNFFATNDWPTSTFFTSHRASFAKPTDTICKACIKIQILTFNYLKIHDRL
jgi:hypothetical protein